MSINSIRSNVQYPFLCDVFLDVSLQAPFQQVGVSKQKVSINTLFTFLSSFPLFSSLLPFPLSLLNISSLPTLTLPCFVKTNIEYSILFTLNQ